MLAETMHRYSGMQTVRVVLQSNEPAHPSEVSWNDCYRSQWAQRLEISLFGLSTRETVDLSYTEEGTSIEPRRMSVSWQIYRENHWLEDTLLDHQQYYNNSTVNGSQLMFDTEYTIWRPKTPAKGIINEAQYNRCFPGSYGSYSPIRGNLAYQADQHEKWESLVTSVRRSYDLCSEQIRRSNKDMECYTASSEHTSLTRKRDSDMQDIPSRSSTRRTVLRHQTKQPHLQARTQVDWTGRSCRFRRPFRSDHWGRALHCDSRVAFRFSCGERWPLSIIRLEPVLPIGDVMSGILDESVYGSKETRWTTAGVGLSAFGVELMNDYTFLP